MRRMLQSPSLLLSLLLRIVIPFQRRMNIIVVFCKDICSNVEFKMTTHGLMRTSVKVLFPGFFPVV